MDGLTARFKFREQPVSFFDLPDFARDSLGDGIRFGKSVGQIESLIAGQPGDSVRIAPPMAAELAVFMSQNSHRQVLRLYWTVDPSALEGILDQVRTRLVQAGRRAPGRYAARPEGPDTRPGRTTVQSINITTGDNSSVTVTAPLAVAHRRGVARAEASSEQTATDR